MNNTSIPTNWRAVWALGLLNTVFIFSMLVYNNFQTPVLQALYLTNYAPFLTLVAGIAPIVVAPLAGWLTDRYHYLGGRAFLWIEITVTLTALLFVAVALSLSYAPPGLLHFLPYIMALWIVAVNSFHSPVNSLLKTFAPLKSLPQANSLIVLMMNTMFALAPIMTLLVNGMGGVATFLLGAVLLLGSAYWFVRSAEISLAYKTSGAPETPARLWIVVLCGLVYGITRFFLINRFDDFVGAHLAAFLPFDVRIILSALLFIAALLCLPIGKYAERVGAAKLLLLGFALFLATALLSIWVQGGLLGILVALLLCLSLAVVHVNALPVAMQYMNHQHAALYTGLYWSAFYIAAYVLGKF